MTRILVVDDHELFREGVVASLSSEEWVTEVLQAGSVAQAAGLLRDAAPDLILLDISLPEESGLEAIPRFRRAAPDARIVMLTIWEDPAVVLKALKAGAAGYLVKGTRVSVFLEALRSVLDGESYVSPAVAGRLLRELQREAEEAHDFDELSPREAEVLSFIAQGATNRDIADALVISEKTVKRHVTSVLAKLHARNRTEAALRAVAARDPGQSSGPTST